MAARRLLQGASALAVLFLALSFAVATQLAEMSIHPSRMRVPGDTAALANKLAQASDATAEKVIITANDGVRLSAWWLLPRNTRKTVAVSTFPPWRRAAAPFALPRQSNSTAVIICHGVGDSSFGALGFAPLFLKRGYSVLVPDSRGHGESLGFVTYGVRESADAAEWFSWVKGRGVSRVFGLGESLGAAILIQSLALGADFQALVAESSYSSFAAVADERVSRVVPSPLAKLLVREAALYVRLRYRVNLLDARPEVAIREARVPILLIHGKADDQTSPENSIRLEKVNPRFTTLWLVQGAKHTGAYSAAPVCFERRVLEWFR